MPTPAPWPVFDTHSDALQRDLDLGHDLGTRTPGHLDLVRGAEGGLGALVLVCWCDPAYLEGGGAARRTWDLLGAGHRLLARHPERVAWAGDGAALREAREAGRIAATFGIEGGHSLEGSLKRLEAFFHAGVRVLTLVWNNHLDWIRSCQDGAGPGVPEGLSPFGREVVARMNRLGMVVDLSHAGERSFYDALEVSSAPVLASHSGCFALHDHPRNLKDAQLRALADQGGVVGMVFCTPFLDADARAEEVRLRTSAEYQGLEGANPTELFLRQAQWMQAHATPLPLERVLDHLCHAVEVAGIDAVGIGSDYDGIERTPEGLEDSSCYPHLAAGMLRRGFAEDEVARVFFTNSQRVFDAATRPAAGVALGPLPAEALGA